MKKTSILAAVLIIKVLLVAILLSLATANKLRFMPRLRAGDPTAAHHLSWPPALP